MQNKYIAIGLICGSLFSFHPAGAKSAEKSYKNKEFGFSVAYPANYQSQELKWVKESMGVDLSGKNGVIRVQAMPAGTDYADMPFDEYARIAALSEIQNYEKLLTIEAFVSSSDVVGYKTYWQVLQHEDTDKGSIDTVTVSGPIYYFPPHRQKLLGEQPVKTIMISFGGAPGRAKQLEREAEAVARSFRYNYSFLPIFQKKHAGKRYNVLKNKKFVVELPSNPTTGFNWFLDNMDEKHFKVESSGFRPAKSKLVGAPGVAYFDLVPIKEGKSTLKLLYYRPWESPAKAVDSYSVNITINNGD